MNQLITHKFNGRKINKNFYIIMIDSNRHQNLIIYYLALDYVILETVGLLLHDFIYFRYIAGKILVGLITNI